MADVSAERYIEVMLRNKDNEYAIKLNSIEVGMLHGALKLMLSHPEVIDLCQDYHVMADALIAGFNKCFKRMGFTDEEIEDLNTRVE